MSYKTFNCCIIACFIAVLLFSDCTLWAATIQLPNWHLVTAKLETAPIKGEAVSLFVEVKAIIGKLSDTKVKIILPETWTSDKLEQTITSVNFADSKTVVFKVTPKTYLSPGSIIIETSLISPKRELITHVKTNFKDDALALVAAVEQLPAQVKNYIDVSFSITENESFYPVSGGLWVTYDDRFSPESGFRGAVYYQDSLITEHQATTDIEMFTKLKHYIAAAPELEGEITGSGINLNEKRLDFLGALYAMAVKAYQKGEMNSAAALIRRLENEAKDSKSSLVENLVIAAGNLKGIVHWAQGQNRLAEDAFRKTFYVNRRNPLQRYVLRNIGLFMFANKDKDTALSMYQLALNFNKTYTLLKREYELIKAIE